MFPRRQGTSRASSACLVALLACTAPGRADITSLTLNPTSVIGTDTSQLTITLNVAFPAQTRTVTLTSSNPAVASVPQSVVFLPGQNQRSVTVSTTAVPTSTNVTITATQNNTRQAVLTVRPPNLVSVTFNPNPVVGGHNSVATITINRPAPANWLCSIQGPFPPIYFSTGSIVSFTPGTLSTTKVVNTQAVVSAVNCQITVNPPTGQSPSVSGILQVVPVRVQSISLDPSIVAAGEAVLACVTLNAPAPPGGASVQLASSDPAVATVAQAPLEIPPGDDDACFIVQSHASPPCSSATISATYGGATVEATLRIRGADQLTDNAANDRWNSRNSSTARGKVLWTDGQNVFYDDGASTQTIQPLGALENVEDSVLALGSGSGANDVIGAWRRGTDFAWVWRSAGGGPPLLVSATNPIDPGQPMNPEALAIADGAVFMTLQAFAGGESVKHVFRIDPATGQATNLTGSAAVPGATRITTSGGKAAWVFDDGSGTLRLHYYNGATVQVIDSGAAIGNPRLSRGRIVYTKPLAGSSHVFLYDTNLPGPAPVRISPDTDPSRGHFAPVTDGRHVAWLHGNADGTNLHILLTGGVQLTDATNRPANLGNADFPIQLQRGQLLWKDATSALRFAASGDVETVCLLPAVAASAPWLSDGVIAWFGPADGDPAADNEIFLAPGASPDDADQPAPPIYLLATAGDRQVSLRFDTVLGATTYNVYLARQPGVTKDNYASLPGGRRVTGITSNNPIIGGLENGVTYYFVVTAVEGADEGGNSMETSATPARSWTPADGAAGIAFFAVAADPLNPQLAYAAGGSLQSGNVYRTTDGGSHWTQLGGAIAGRRTRALAVRGVTVFAVTIDGQVLRSNNAGANWAVVADGEGYGQITAAVAIDPASPQVVYAGTIRLTPDAPSFIIRSIDGGDTWSHVASDEIIPYCLAVDSAGVVYAGGSALPAIGRSADGGATWTDVSAVIDQTYAFAIDPASDAVVYAGTGSHGFYRSTDAGQSWTQRNNGLPLGDYEPVYAIVVDPAQPGALHLGTALGPYSSSDAGATWIANHVGMGPIYTYGLARTASGRLIAATENGLFLLDPAACIEDLNGDGAVGLSDLTILLAHYGVPSGATPQQGDLNGDGAIGLQDLTLLLAAFGSTCD